MKAKVVAAGLAALSLAGAGTRAVTSKPSEGSLLRLPAPGREGGMSLTQALDRRRSVREFTGRPLTLAQVAQLCWAAQGITDAQGHRAAPSAGATYPLRLYAAMPEGLFLYAPDRHVLESVVPGDQREALARKATGQAWNATAGAIFILCGNVSITAARYGDRARQYVWQEVGHASQNLLLQATALGLGATPVGAFDPVSLAGTLRLSKPWEPMAVLPVGGLK